MPKFLQWEAVFRTPQNLKERKAKGIQNCFHKTLSEMFLSCKTNMVKLDCPAAILCKSSSMNAKAGLDLLS